MICKALRDHGVDARIWSVQGGPGICDEVEVPFERGKFRDVLTRLDWSFVHDHGIWLPLHHRVAKECQTQQVKRVLSPRGMLEPWALAHHRWRKKLTWILYQRADLHRSAGLHATSAAEATQLRSLGFEGPIATIPNGVEHPREHDPAPFNQQPEAVFMSRIHPKKGLPMLVEAWSQVRPPGWKMKVIGPDERGHRAEVEELVRSHGLQDEWTFSAAVTGDGRWDALRGAQLFILPSYSENFGVVIAEALCVGLPVITTTGTPWARLVEQGCGMQVAPTPTALAWALTELTSIPALERQQLGRRGRAWIESEFTWPPLGLQMKRFYGDL